MVNKLVSQIIITVGNTNKIITINNDIIQLEIEHQKIKTHWSCALKSIQQTYWIIFLIYIRDQLRQL